MLLVGLSILAFSFLAVDASAQNGSATLIVSTQQVVLDESQPLADTYEIDFSATSVVSEQAASAYFAKYASQGITFTFDLRKKVAYMTLHQGFYSDANLNVAQWNNILYALNNK